MEFAVDGGQKTPGPPGQEATSAEVEMLNPVFKIEDELSNSGPTLSEKDDSVKKDDAVEGELSKSGHTLSEKDDSIGKDDAVEGELDKSDPTLSEEDDSVEKDDAVEGELDKSGPTLSEEDDSVEKDDAVEGELDKSGPTLSEEDDSVAEEPDKSDTALDDEEMFESVILAEQFVPWKSQSSQSNRHSAPTRRLSVLHWNPGGLSSARFREFVAWCGYQKLDLVCLSETRWHFEAEWQDDSWRFIHTGAGQNTDTASGILFMCSRKLCHMDDLAWTPVIAGRMAHFRLFVHPRPLDIICGYQHVDHPSSSQRAARSSSWDQLHLSLQAVPRRNGCLLLGDFNCQVSPLPTQTGAAHFHVHGGLSTGPSYTDQHEFTRIVRDHDLVSLTTWNAKDGPSFLNDTHGSRIDHIFGNRLIVDRDAKSCKYLTEVPFVPDSGPRHRPILSNLPRPRISYGRRASSTHVTYQQKLKSRDALLQHQPTWTAFSTDVLHSVAQISQHNELNTCPLDHLHRDVQLAFHRHFPTHQRTCVEKVNHGIVRQKWDAYHALKQFQLMQMRLEPISVAFQLWSLVTIFRKHDRAHKKWVIDWKKTQIQDSIATADAAARAYDSFALYRTVNWFTPKTDRRKVRFRNNNGSPMGPRETLASLSSFATCTWTGPPLSLPPSLSPPGVPFSCSLLAQAFSEIPSMKGVSYDSAPGISWHEHADALADAIYPLFCQWWQQTPPFIPQRWRRGQLFLIPKPGEATSAPELLRPLALMDPVGKSILGILTKQALHCTRFTLCSMPQFGFLCYRSSLDALARVSSHAKHVRQLQQAARLSVQHRAEGRIRLAVLGGMQIHIDVNKAFDSANRQHIVDQLFDFDFPLPLPLAQLIACWHEGTTYVLDRKGLQAEIAAGKGVRQGCKAAPYLWCVLTHKFMLLVSQRISSQWVRDHLTLFADDMVITVTFHSIDELHTNMHNVGIVLRTLTDLGLTISPSKSHVLLSVGGSRQTQVLQRIQKRTPNGAFLCIPNMNHDPILIPITDRVKCLGAFISFRNSEELTFAHRLDLAKLACRRLSRWLWSKRIALNTRLHMWRSCVFSVLHYGLMAIDVQTVCVGVLRKIVGDHSFQTHHSHRAALDAIRAFWPLHLFEKAILRLRQNLINRAHFVDMHDIVHAVPWHHLETLLSNVRTAQCAGPLSDDHLTSSPRALPLYHCSQCSFCTDHLPALHSHQLIHHNQKHGRVHSIRMPAFSSEGLPHCSHCHKAFTTWRTYRQHVERNVCEDPGPVALAERITDDMERITPAPGMIQIKDLAYLTSKPAGQLTIRLVGERKWADLLEQPEALSMLAQHCALCGIHVSRPQNLHQHLRQYHAQFLDHVLPKAAQLCAAHGTGSPCAACGATFKKSHQCMVWSQLAMLMLYLPPEISGATDTLQQMILTCDICRIRFIDHNQWMVHMKRRKLVLHEFLATRDAVPGTHTSPHCMTRFQSLGGLQQHIIQGMCGNFDVAASTHAGHIDLRWLDFFMNEDVTAIADSPSDCLELTRRCQCCNKHFAGARELGLHLQSQHGTLWQSARSLMQLLQMVLNTHCGCVCAPHIKVHRQDHICLPAAQLAMQFRREQLELWIPFPTSWTPGEQMLSDDLDQRLLQDLQQVVLNRSFADLWTHQEWLHVLQHQCLLCAMHMALEELMQHLEEHLDIAQPYRSALLLMLVPILSKDHLEAVHCPYCFQGISVTAPSAGQLIQHLQAQCPVLSQVICLVQSCEHGRLDHGTRGRATNCRELSEHGSVPAPNSDAGAKRQRNQKSQARKLDARTGSQEPSLQSDAHLAADGPHDPSPGTRVQLVDEPRHVHLLLPQRGQRHDSPPGAVHSGMACIARSESPANWSPPAPCHPGSESLPGIAGQIPEDRSHEIHGGTAGQTASLATGLVAGQLLALPEVGCQGGQAGGGQLSSSGGNGQDAATPGPDLGRAPDGAECCEISDDDCQPGATNSPVAATDPYVLDGPQVAIGLPGAELGLHPSCRPVQAASTPAVRTGQATCPTAQFEQGQVEGQGQGQGSQFESIEGPADHPEMTRRHMQALLQKLVMGNDGSWCFAHSTFQMCLWAVCGTLGFEPHTLRLGVTDLPSMLEHVQDHVFQPTDFGWFQDCVRAWADGSGPADAAEFLELFLRNLGDNGLRCGWEKRLLLSENPMKVRRFDHNASQDSIHLQFQSGPIPDTRITLTALIGRWSQDWSMQSALLAELPLLSVQVDRFFLKDDQLSKLFTEITDFEGPILLPIFTGAHMEVGLVPCVMAAALIHLGTAARGHYQALLRLGDPDGRGGECWLLTDDDQPVTQLAPLPPWVGSSLTSFWLCREDCVSLSHHPKCSPLRNPRQQLDRFLP
eukprot:Skav228301  [mRNA]  locus=scaffold209:323073:334141:- [translate_table: standard]